MATACKFRQGRSQEGIEAAVGVMANSHVEDLKKLRSAFVELPRTKARLTGAVDGMADEVIKIQQAIEAIDRAIEDERGGK